MLIPRLEQVSGRYACFKGGAHQQYRLEREERAYVSGG